VATLFFRNSRIIAVVTSLTFIVWFLVFGGEVVLPICDRISERTHWRDYLTECPADELRVKQYLYGEERQAGQLNLTTGMLQGEGAPWTTWYGPFWSQVRGIFHTINFPMKETPYSPEQLADIRTFLAGLAAPSESRRLASYRQQFHLAFYQGGRLQIYDYPKHEARMELAKLFEILGFNLVGDD